MEDVGKNHRVQNPSDVMRKAEEYCALHGLQFTPVRRKVLEILLGSSQVLGAYDILKHLDHAGFKSQPPVAYRALEFLVKHGFVHKVVHLNAFVACDHPDEEHAPMFMICNECDLVVEVDSNPLPRSFASTTKNSGFHVEEAVIEMKGLCTACAGMVVS
ncbi:MAG: transcriptional repressor [SAR116 cluster bacterium]|nr:Fur family transcriptional regulator [Paracoccaceae bacterium]RCL79994.1 MAG: transcriptional repressor [SAR116 cluster bacterium]RPH13441.1 MAG: transcriptional repressor [Alphaproteobacteria bacterium TMED150]HBQ22982.1 Fur family transcriptional regulator [Alphaproteobacteria bacterium]|tara:strand:+ start:462 stop:938 length:477 start_codon:yes stop_codon:yes gene_type:complete